MKQLGQLILFIVLVVLNMLSSFLGVHIILSIATLYSLSFITQLSFVQIYGAWIIFSLASYKYKKTEKEATTADKYTEAFTRVVTYVITYLLIWGVAFLAFAYLN